MQQDGEGAAPDPQVGGPEVQQPEGMDQWQPAPDNHRPLEPRDGHCP